VYQNNEMAAILVYGTGISSFLFKYFVLFHHPTGATDHVSENDLYDISHYDFRNLNPHRFPALQCVPACVLGTLWRQCFINLLRM
jgi:hypothetical protein